MTGSGCDCTKWQGIKCCLGQPDGPAAIACGIVCVETEIARCKWCVDGERFALRLHTSPASNVVKSVVLRSYDLPFE
jgi:hypothetical protein